MGFPHIDYQIQNSCPFHELINIFRDEPPDGLGNENFRPGEQFNFEPGTRPGFPGFWPVSELKFLPTRPGPEKPGSLPSPTPDSSLFFRLIVNGMSM